MIIQQQLASLLLLLLNDYCHVMPLFRKRSLTTLLYGTLDTDNVVVPLLLAQRWHAIQNHTLAFVWFSVNKPSQHEEGSSLGTLLPDLCVERASDWSSTE